jgi:tryptophanase
VKTIIEPFRIKSVEPLRLTTPDERKAYLAAAHYNGWLKHIPPLQYPGQALACALYEVGGIRACEIGTVMFGRQRDGSEKPAAMDLVRLAPPGLHPVARRLYRRDLRRDCRRAGEAQRLPHRLIAAGFAAFHGEVRAAPGLRVARD